MTEKKRIRKKYFPGSVTAINQRRDEIIKLIDGLKQEGISANRYTVHERLDREKFDVSISTVYKDLVAISRENTWVRDLTESTYSAYQEDIHDKLDWIENEALELYGQNWSPQKNTMKKIPTASGKDKVIIKAEKTDVNHKAKATFLKIILEVQDLKIKHTNGKNIDISAAILGKKFDKAKTKLRNQEETAAQTTAAAFMDLRKNELYRN